MYTARENALLWPIFAVSDSPDGFLPFDGAWLIERIVVNVSLAAMHIRGNLRAALHSEEDGLGDVVLHSEEVFAASLEHSVDGTIVHLSRTQWIKMQLRRRESEKVASLRDVASGKEVDVKVGMDTVRNMCENVSVPDKILSTSEVICLSIYTLDEYGC